MAPVRRGRRSVMHEGHGHSSKMPNMHKINDMHHKNNLSRLSERGSELEEARKRGLSTELPPDRESSMRLSMFGNDLQKELRGRLATGSLPAPPPPNAAAPPLVAAPPPVPALAAATAPAEGKAPSRAVPPPPAGRPKGEVVDAKLAHQNNKTKASALLQAPPPPRRRRRPSAQKAWQKARPGRSRFRAWSARATHHHHQRRDQRRRGRVKNNNCRRPLPCPRRRTWSRCRRLQRRTLARDHRRKSQPQPQKQPQPQPPQRRAFP